MSTEEQRRKWREHSAEYRKKYPEKAKEYNRKSYFKNHDVAMKKRRDYSRKESTKLRAKERLLLRKYGISIEQYLSMIRDQNGKCAICECSLDPMKKSTNVDHNHSTQKIRGILCTNCNTMLGLVREKSEILRSAIGYLERNKDVEME